MIETLGLPGQEHRKKSYSLTLEHFESVLPHLAQSTVLGIMPKFCRNETSFSGELISFKTRLKLYFSIQILHMEYCYLKLLYN